jgi:hypothetical protein
LEVFVNIHDFMQGYKAAWEQRDDTKFCALFAADGEYHNTPFAVQRGHVQLAAYWDRVKLQQDVHLEYDVLASTPTSGIAHWHVTYQVASEELFRTWSPENPVTRCQRWLSMESCRQPFRMACARIAGFGGTAFHCLHDTIIRETDRLKLSHFAWLPMCTYNHSSARRSS